MGMAAGQARLLSITSRMADNELRAQIINNNKMRLATQSSQVSESYVAALNKAQMMFTNYDADNNRNYQSLTFNALTTYNPYNNQYAISNNSGQILVSEKDALNFQAANGNEAAFLASYGIEQNTSYFDNLSKYTNEKGNVLFSTGEYEPDGKLRYIDSGFTPEELKQMYEGDASIDLPSYENIIHTELYSNYAKNLADMQSQYEEYKKQTYELMNKTFATGYAGNAENGLGFPVNTSSMTGINATDNFQLSDKTQLYNISLNELEGFISNIDTTNTNNTNISDLLKCSYGLFDIIRDCQAESLTNQSIREDDQTRITDFFDSFIGVNGLTLSYGNTGVQASNNWTSPTFIVVKDPKDTPKFHITNTESETIGSLSSLVSGYSVETQNKLNENGEIEFDSIKIKKETDKSGNTTWAYLTWNDEKDTWNTDWTNITGNQFTHEFKDKPTNSTGTKIDFTIEEANGTYTLKRVEPLDAENLKQGLLSIIDEFRSGLINQEIWSSSSAFFRQKDSEAYKTYAEAGKNMSLLLFNTDIGADYYENFVGGNRYNFIKEILRKFEEEAQNITTPVPGYNGVLFNTSKCIFLDAKNKVSIPTQDKNGTLQMLFNVMTLDYIMDNYGEPEYSWIDVNNPDVNGDAKYQWYHNLFNRMSQGYATLQDGLASSKEWIQFAFESGLINMEQVDSKNNWNTTLYTNCSDITEQTDSAAVAKAEAEYKAAMNKIQNKDKRYDLELKNIDTEHNSLQTEYDSIKTAVGKNIERSFKIYG